MCCTKMFNIRFPLPLELSRMIVRYLQSHRRLVFTSYRGADKSLARQGRKQARKHVKDARDFNNIWMRVAIMFFFL